jgi:hypothetical protein
LIGDFYSYIQEVDEEDVITYSFATSNNILYSVYFDPYAYSVHVDKYPDLLNLGFTFGFYRVSSTQEAWVQDPMIGITISKIVFDFIQEYGDDVVLLYHCDYADRKQEGRDKIFHQWYELSEIKHSIIKKRIEIKQVEENGTTTAFYLGYLTSIQNPKRENIQNEFSLFAENLSANKL